MAITDCHIDRSLSADIDNRNRGTYSARYIVETNRAESKMGAKQVLNGCLAANLITNGSNGSPNHPIPNLGAAYNLTALYGTGESDPYSYALSYHAEPDAGNAYRYYIDVNWTPLSPGEDNDSRTKEDPEDRGARFRWDTETYLVPVDRDRKGQPYVNGAGKSFDRPPQIERQRPLLVVKFNVASLDETVTLVQTYGQAVNSVPWTFFTPDAAARTVKCQSARSGDLVTEQSYSYYPMEFIFAFAESGETWDERSLNECYGHYEEADGQTYGYAFASANFDENDSSIPLTGGVVVAGSQTAPSSVANPTPKLSGLAGDQISIVYESSAWSVGEPVAKVDASGRKVYRKAKTLDASGNETSDDVASPILLYGTGVRLPEGMIGNFISGRLRREVDFNGLNSYLTAAS